jgi:hypothetical protein
MSEKELLDEQILIEEGRFKLRYLSRSAVYRLIERALTRMRASGWEFRAMNTRGFLVQTSTYVFEFVERSSQATSVSPESPNQAVNPSGGPGRS